MAEGTVHKLVLVLCTFFIPVALTLSQQCPTNPNGTAIWGSLPKLGTFSPKLEYANDEQRLGMLSGMARGFVSMVTTPAAVSETLDYLADLISDLVATTITMTSAEYLQMVQMLAAILVGVSVCLSMGIAYFILVPIIGMFFGFCRCCDNCGGKRVQESSKCPGCLRVFYTVFLLCVTGVLCAGMAYTNFSNDFIGYVYTKTKPSMLDVFGDAQTFAAGALNQIEYITDDEYGRLECLVRADINNIGDGIADPLVKYLKTDAGVQDAMDAFSGLMSNLSDTYVALENINSSTARVINGTASLKVLLDGVKATLDGLSCSDCPDSSNLTTVADYSLLPPVETQMTAALNAKTLTESLYTNFDNTLASISTAINQSAEPAVKQVEDVLSDMRQNTEDIYQSASDVVSKLNETLIDAQKTIITLIDDIYKSSDYRYYGLIGVTCLTLLIVLFNVIGIAMGTFSYKDVSPTERSRMSNAGGNVLMAGVFFSIIFGPILILLCFVLFATSGTATLMCQPLNTLEIFEKIIDKPNVIGPGYYLDTLLKDYTENLTFSSVLTKCEQDTGIYSAFQLSNLFSLEDLEQALETGRDEVLNVLTSDIDIPTLDLVPDDLNIQLMNAIGDIKLGDIDPTAFQLMLDQPVTAENLTDFARRVRAATASNPTISADLEAIAKKLEMIQAEEVEPINIQKAEIETSVNELADLNSALPASILNTVNKSLEAEINVNLPATDQEVQNITTVYVNQVFGYADQFLDHVYPQLEKDLAPCLPLRNAYNKTVNLACYYVLDSLNTMWFMTGWCAIFFLPSIIVAVRLAKYYRIMDEEAQPKVKKTKSARGRRSNQDMAMGDLPEDGHHTGHDNIRLVETIGQGGMQPQQNPHYIPDDVINGYDGYNNLGRPMAPPPAYHPGEPLNIPPHDYYF